MASHLPITVVAAWLIASVGALAQPAAAPAGSNQLAQSNSSTNARTAPKIVARTIPPGLGQVQFLNGDSLRGKLVSIDDQRQVQWDNPDIASPIEFPLGSIARVRLPTPQARPEHAAANCLVHLRNGDEVKGRILLADA